MEEKRAYSQSQFEALCIDTKNYKFNEIEGVFSGTLDYKKWGKTRNIVAFVTLDDGRQIVCCAWQENHKYLGIPEIPMETRIKLTFAPNSKGRMCLIAVRSIDENGCPII